MDTTVILYVAMLIVLGGTAVWLVLRDLSSGQPQQEVLRASEELTQLPMAADEPAPESLSDTIDQRFRHLIYQSGLDLTPQVALLLIVFFGLLVGGAAFIWRDDILAGVIGTVVGMALPLALFVRTRTERLRKIREQLPDAMDMLARTVRAGETLEQSFVAVGGHAQEPLGIELRRCARQLDMGLSVPAAMRSLVRRAPLTELRILGTALNVQRRSGGNLALTVERMSDVIRDRLSYQRQFMAATGASRMGTILIALAGPIVFTYMLLWQPDYVGQFFSVPGGYTLLGVAVLLQLVGLTWIIGLLRSNY